MKEQITTIKLRKITAELLNKVKIHPRQPYNEAISVILKNHGTSKIEAVSHSKGSITTIKLTKGNVERLGNLKIHPLQPYEEVVLALVKEYLEKNGRE